VSYYEYIFRRYEELHGDLAYPELVIYDVSFQRFADWMREDDWDSIKNALVNGLNRLSAAGADFGIIATNTMHLLFEELEADSALPLISIVEATAEAIRKDGLSFVGLLGTRFTMEKPFYIEGFKRHGIQTVVPAKEDRDYINRVVFEELAKGKILAESRNEFLHIIDNLTSRGAQGIVLGCTEISLLVTPESTEMKLFNTVVIHADKALKHAISPPPQTQVR
jgi:aspartate racemase